MDIKEVKEGKKQYLDLLLLADEQENMIDRYLTKGTMYVLEDDGVKSECVVLDVGGGVLEIKNIATDPQFHGKGYGAYHRSAKARHYRRAIWQTDSGPSH